jgi:glycosyltransferase involved in cell wall biosynthesis
VVAILYVLPILLVKRHVFRQKILVYGPADSMLLNLFEKTLSADRIFTDGEDVHHRQVSKPLQAFYFVGHPDQTLFPEYCFRPNMEQVWLNNYRAPFQTGNIVNIGYMSHFSRHKGILDICSALLMLPERIQKNIVFHVASNGVVNDKLVRSSYDVFCSSFKGVIRTDKKVNPFEFMRALDLYIYPFHFKKHTFNVPLTLLEASLSGAFVIGPDLENVKPWLTRPSLVKPNSPELLSTMILNSMSDTERSTSVVNDNIKKISNHVNFTEHQRV